jgi:predicted membrane protein
MDEFDIMIIVFVILVIVAVVICIVADHKTEVETYTVHCEISQLVYAEEATGRSSSRPVYKMGVRCDEFATTIDIDSTDFARYTIGDLVEVEVTVWEYLNGKHTQTYKLVK